MAGDTAHRWLQTPIWLGAGTVAGFGLGALVLALWAPVSDPGAGGVATGTSAPATLGGDPVAETATWPPVFGTVAPPDTATDAPVALAEDPTWNLRGMVVDGADGWAILSDGTEDVLVSVGSALGESQRVVAITLQGVEIAGAAGSTLVAFPDDATAAPTGPEPTTLAPGRPPRVLTAQLPLEEIRETGLQRMMGLAGGAQIVELEDGRRAQEIIWVRNGRLYDRVGLRPGDIIVSINDIPAGDADVLMQAVPSLATERSFVLAVLRDGEQVNVEISIE